MQSGVARWRRDADHADDANGHVISVDLLRKPEQYQEDALGSCIKILIRERRGVGGLDHHERMIDRLMACITALGELIVGHGEFFGILLFDGGFDGVHRLAQRRVDQLSHRQTAQTAAAPF